ncbi:hypothetical protein [Bacillus cereus]|uniref:hypothetical protein n=1 Tax=Bacillus cereus TaxID=1396 RepID=UPI00164248FF|nr:hypothetical protein [Bacillus cereus]
MFSFDRAIPQLTMHPGGFASQFSPGMQITVTIPGSPPISGTLIQIIPPSTAKIQLQNGSIQLVDIHQISTASPGIGGGGGWPGGGFPSGSGWPGGGFPSGGGWPGGGFPSGGGWPGGGFPGGGFFPGGGGGWIGVGSLPGGGFVI